MLALARLASQQYRLMDGRMTGWIDAWMDGRCVACKGLQGYSCLKDGRVYKQDILGWEACELAGVEAVVGRTPSMVREQQASPPPFS